MTTTTTVTDTIVTERSGAVQLIELNRPGKKNAVTLAMYEALTAAITQAEQDPEIRSILVHGRGDRRTAGRWRPAGRPTRPRAGRADARRGGGS
jgi:enoyl-CoA hydratase/carnithine racemase